VLGRADTDGREARRGGMASRGRGSVAMPERRARVREDGGNADDGGAVAKVTGTGTSARPCHAVVRCYGRMSSAGAGKTRGSSALVAGRARHCGCGARRR